MTMQTQAVTKPGIPTTARHNLLALKCNIKVDALTAKEQELVHLLLTEGSAGKGKSVFNNKFNDTEQKKAYAAIELVYRQQPSLDESKGGMFSNALGSCKYHGLGVAKDLSASVTHFKTAALLSNRNAHYQLATMYEEGEWVSCDLKQAIYHLTCAAQLGLACAQSYLGQTFRAGDDMLAQDHRAAVYWFKLAAVNSPYASYCLADYYLKGEGGIKQDISVALHYYQQAAKSRSVDAFHKLGQLYSEGIHVEKNIDKAIDYYLQGSSFEVEEDDQVCTEAAIGLLDSAAALGEITFAKLAIVRIKLSLLQTRKVDLGKLNTYFLQQLNDALKHQYASKHKERLQILLALLHYLASNEFCEGPSAIRILKNEAQVQALSMCFAFDSSFFKQFDPITKGGIQLMLLSILKPVVKATSNTTLPTPQLLSFNQIMGPKGSMLYLESFLMYLKHEYHAYPALNAILFGHVVSYFGGKLTLPSNNAISHQNAGKVLTTIYQSGILSLLPGGAPFVQMCADLINQHVVQGLDEEVSDTPRPAKRLRTS